MSELHVNITLGHFEVACVAGSIVFFAIKVSAAELWSKKGTGDEAPNLIRPLRATQANFVAKKRVFRHEKCTKLLK